jgi:hypothetical protein
MAYLFDRNFFLEKEKYIERFDFNSGTETEGAYYLALSGVYRISIYIKQNLQGYSTQSIKTLINCLRFELF